MFFKKISVEASQGDINELLISTHAAEIQELTEKVSKLTAS